MTTTNYLITVLTIYIKIQNEKQENRYIQWYPCYIQWHDTQYIYYVQYVQNALQFSFSLTDKIRFEKQSFSNL